MFPLSLQRFRLGGEHDPTKPRVYAYFVFSFFLFVFFFFVLFFVETREKNSPFSQMTGCVDGTDNTKQSEQLFIGTEKNYTTTQIFRLYFFIHPLKFPKLIFITLLLFYVKFI